ncbi:MAG TPA: (Fe-S)-binding protein [Steroidobacteraceae bacterium]|nr:(Fe-S)-binding protein [Steroidobacteraceae bacterium]
MTVRSMTPREGDDSPLAQSTGNISNCWRCSHCKWVPSPKSKEFAHACPSIQWGKFHAYSGGGKLITAFALKEHEADYTEAALESIFACTMCGACDTSCKNNNGELVEPLSVLYALRAQVATEGRSLPAHVTMIDNLRREGNAAGRRRTERSNWCEGLGLKDALTAPVDVWLHIGCENAFEPRLWPELKAIVVLLERARVNFGIAYNREAATGETAYDLGFHDEARALAQSMTGLIRDTGVRTVVTCSSSSYAGIRNIWPRLGFTSLPCEVFHVSDYVERLIETGKLSIEGSFEGAVTYHDPCKLGRLSEKMTPSKASWTKVLGTMSVFDGPKQVLFGNDGLYEAPRKLLNRLHGLKLVEMERNRVSSYCCGAAGGAKEAYPDFSKFAAERRLAEAKATGASIIATACGGCRIHLSDVAKQIGAPLAVKGIFELLAASAVPSVKVGG